MRVDYVYEGTESTVRGVTRIERGGDTYLVSLEGGDAIHADTLEVVQREESVATDDDHLQRAYEDLDAIRRDADQALTALAHDDTAAAERLLRKVRDRAAAWEDPEVTE